MPCCNQRALPPTFPSALLLDEPVPRGPWGAGFLVQMLPPPRVMGFGWRRWPTLAQGLDCLGLVGSRAASVPFQLLAGSADAPEARDAPAALQPGKSAAEPRSRLKMQEVGQSGRGVDGLPALLDQDRHGPRSTINRDFLGFDREDFRPSVTFGVGSGQRTKGLDQTQLRMAYKPCASADA